MEPLTLTALGGVALTEGIKFLYGQAGELLKRWRERQDGEHAQKPIAPMESDVVEGQLASTQPDWDALDRLKPDLQSLRRELGDYADGLEDVDPTDEGLLRSIDALRRSLEVVLGQRITFAGEDREPSGPTVIARSEIEEVAGYAAAVRAEHIASGRIEAEQRTKVVGAEGEAVAVDVKRIG